MFLILRYTCQVRPGIVAEQQPGLNVEAFCRSAIRFRTCDVLEDQHPVLRGWNVLLEGHRLCILVARFRRGFNRSLIELPARGRIEVETCQSTSGSRFFTSGPSQL